MAYLVLGVAVPLWFIPRLSRRTVTFYGRGYLTSQEVNTSSFSRIKPGIALYHHDPTTLNLHAIMPRSRVNGPGNRTAIWLQGCALRCPGCFNPATLSHARRFVVPVEELVRRIRQEALDTDGITISGGEPLEQSRALLAFLRRIRERTRLSVVLFTGFELEEIRGLGDGADIVSHVDVLITGRFVQEKRLSRGLRGSTNQEIHLITDRYCHADITDTPPAEICIDAHGTIRLSGVDPPDLAGCNERDCALWVR